MKMKLTQLCPNLCNPMDYTVHGILLARILEWVVLFPSPGDLPNPGIKPKSPALAGGFFTTEPLGSPKGSLPEAFTWHLSLMAIVLHR